MVARLYSIHRRNAGANLIRAELNMLKILPNFPSQTSKNFDPLFYFIPTSSPIIPILILVILLYR